MEKLLENDNLLVTALTLGIGALAGVVIVLWRRNVWLEDQRSEMGVQLAVQAGEWRATLDKAATTIQGLSAKVESLSRDRKS